MKRFYFAMVEGKAIPVTKDGKVISGKAFGGMMVEKWALLIGRSERHLKKAFLEGTVSEWFTR